jgi:hypothetical protein
VLLALAVSGCAQHYTADANLDPYGFFSGVWHGFVFPYALMVNLVSWVLSLLGIEFFSSIQLFGRPNTDMFFYYVGFLAGISVYGGGAR